MKSHKTDMPDGISSCSMQMNGCGVNSKELESPQDTAKEGTNEKLMRERKKRWIGRERERGAVRSASGNFSRGAPGFLVTGPDQRQGRRIWLVISGSLRGTAASNHNPSGSS